MQIPTQDNDQLAPSVTAMQPDPPTSQLPSQEQQQCDHEVRRSRDRSHESAHRRDSSHDLPRRRRHRSWCCRSRSRTVQQQDRQVSLDYDDNDDDDRYSGSLSPKSVSSAHHSDIDILNDMDRDIQQVDAGDEFDEVANEFITENYVTKKTNDLLSPPVASLLADTINGWLSTVPSKETIKLAFEKC